MALVFVGGSLRYGYLHAAILVLAVLPFALVTMGLLHVLFARAQDRRRYVAEIDAKNHQLAIKVEERRQAEESLRESEALYHELYELESDALFLIDNEFGQIIEANGAACGLYGFNREELLALKNTDLSAEPEETQRVTQTVPVSVDGIVHVPLRYHRKKDGTVFPVEITGRFFERHGRSVHIAAIRDITQRKQVEDALASRTAALSSIFRSAPVGIGVVIERVFTEVNETLCTMTGYARQELLGRNARMLYLTQEDYDDVGRVKYEQIRQEGIGSVETRWQRKDGRIIHILLSSSPLDMQDWARGITFSALDITQRKEAEAQSRLKSEELSRFFTVALDLLAIAGMDGCFRRLNPQWKNTLGYELNELVGKNFFDFIHPDDLAATQEAMQSLSENKSVLDFVNRYRHKNGSYRWIEWRSYPVGELIYAAARDITGRKEVLEAIQTSQEAERKFSERLTRLVSAIAELSTIPDFDGLCRRAVELGIGPLGFERMGLWFYTPDQQEMVGSFGVDEQGRLRDERGVHILVHAGRPQQQMNLNHDPYLLIEDRDLHDQHANLIAQGKKLVCSLWDGKKVIGIVSTDNLLTLRAFTEQDREVLRIFSVALGHLCSLKLAERKLSTLTMQLEQRVQERTAQLEAANKELEAFAYSVSHDLRTPLRAVDGFSRMLLEDYAAQLDGDAQYYLERLRAAAQHMGQLIDDLLNLSRLSRAQMRLTTVSLTNMVQEIAVGLHENQPERQVEFSIAPDVTVIADASLIRIALDNLLRNAWKFTSRKAQAHIEFGCLNQDDEKVYFVRDDGAGFNMEYAHKLFGAFQRLHSPGEFEGTGIGLTIVHRILGRHGGRIWAEGMVDQGAVFYFTLPKGL
ncbi:MAG: PAS domain-containing sensor histidine kinase [Chloroflexota bacterium]